VQDFLKAAVRPEVGGLIENAYMRNCQVGQVADAVLSIDYFYEEGQRGTHTPVVRNVELRHVTSHKSTYACVVSPTTRRSTTAG
jgi:hypothetical protein